MTPWIKTYPPDRADEGRQEARVLRLVAHPGVVQLLDLTEGDDGTVRLHLAQLPGPDLLAAASADRARAASLAAAVAAVVADLHGVGVAHGAIAAHHVLLDRDEAPVLCGFGHATVDADTHARRADVEALGRLVGVLLASGAGSMSGWRVRAAVGRCRSAEAMARQLARLSAQLPTSEPPRPRRRHRRLAWVAGALVACSVLTWVAFGRSSSPAPNEAASSCPVTDAGCRPVAAPGGVIDVAAGRFQAGAPGDVIVLGRWDCGPEGVPAVLRPSTGQVWVFDRWPAGERGVRARLVARVPDARSLRVIPGRCDRIEVVRAHGHPVPLAAGSTGALR